MSRGTIDARDGEGERIRAMECVLFAVWARTRFFAPLVSLVGLVLYVKSGRFVVLFLGLTLQLALPSILVFVAGRDRRKT